MKSKVKLIAILVMCVFFSARLHAQQSVLDIAGIHQLISQSKAEHNKQVDAKNKQAVVTADEQANLTLIGKMQRLYRTLQNRYNTLGTAINLADIGITATPLVRHIVANQAQVIQLVEKNPAIAFLGLQTEIEFVEKAEALVGYVTGLTLSLGDVNQMKASDRKLLFDYVIVQLSIIQELSGNLVNTLSYSNLSTLLRSINPFQNFIDEDKNLAEDMIKNAKYLK